MRHGAAEKRLLALSLLLFLVSVLLVLQIPQRLRAREKEKEYSETYYQFSQLFTEIFLDVQDKYVENIDSKRLFEGAIRGMFLALDNHSQYLDPDSYNQLEKDTEGEFSGIGIHITIRNGILTVMAPIPGSPAAKMGLLPWDRIVEIEGDSTKDITLIEAVKKLTGPPGTKVNITIFREATQEELDFAIERANVLIKSVYSRILDEHIGYIRLARFSDNTGENLRKVLLDYKDKGIDSLVMDLRYNTGGLLKEAIEISSLFLPKDALIVSTEGRLKSQNHKYRSKSHELVDWPMIILVNRATASASEILAGALKDHQRAVLMGPSGTTTFGKGSVQTINPLDFSLEKDEAGNFRPSAIRLTTARYYTPSGVTFHDKGLVPDLEVELPEGHELKLSMLGLLGEVHLDDTPDTENSQSNDTEVDKESEEDVTEQKDQMNTEAEKDESEEESPFYRQQTDEEKPETEEESFVDIQLEEALKVIRAYLIMNPAKKAA